MNNHFWLDPYYATHDAAETKSLKFRTLYNFTVDEFFLDVLLKVLMVLVGIGGLLYIQYDFRPKIANGTSLMATVLQCSVDIPGGKENDTVKFSFEYTYGNKVLQFQKSVTGDFIHDYACNDFPKGSLIQIQFQPGLPTNTEIVDGRVSIPPSEVNQLNIIMVITLLYGIGTLYNFVRRIRKYQIFRRSGVVLLGEVRNAQYENGSGSSKSKRYMKIQYQFLTPGNTPIEGTYWDHHVNMTFRQLPEPGTIVSVFYIDKKNYYLL